MPSFSSEPCDPELHVDPLGAPDPVALHGAHLLRPARQAVQGTQQLLGVVRDAHEPLLDLALLHRGPGAPPLAVDDLLVGEHGLIDGVPVDRGRLAVGQALAHQAGEQPLLPPVVVRVAGGQLPVPVVAKPQALQLVLHVGDVERVHWAGGRPCLMAAFSAGSPKASQPMGWSTFLPRARW